MFIWIDQSIASGHHFYNFFFKIPDKFKRTLVCINSWYIHAINMINIMKNRFLRLGLFITVLTLLSSNEIWATHDRGQQHLKKKKKVEIIIPNNAPGIASHFRSRLAINGQMRSADQVHQGIDIKGPIGQPIIAIADGMVLDAVIESCWGPTIAIDHGNGHDGKKLITLYGHLGEMLVGKGSKVVRGQIIGKLGNNENDYKCIWGVRHLHLQIGQKYRSNDQGSAWGWRYFLKDGHSSLNPHHYWADGIGVVTCFEQDRTYNHGYITYPVPCD